MSIYAGLDAGTQSVKLVVYDADARQLLASASAPLELISGSDGSREQHASDWLDALQACFAEIEPALRRRIRGLSISGQQHGFVPLDAAGQVLGPVKLWCDTSSDRECIEIMKAVGGRERCIALAGNPILAGYTASKLPWTRRQRPQVYARMASILLPHDYLNFYFTGQRFMEHGDASGTGWLDVRTRSWSDALLAATDADRDLRACLPPLVEVGESFAILAATADTLGLSHELRVAVGGGDNMMAAIGTGAVTPGRLAMSLGTSGTLFAYSEQPVVSAQGEWAAFCSSTGGWLPLICTMNCTVATEQMARLLGIHSHDGDALIDASRPGAGGMMMLPFFNGERTPNLPDAKASLHGISEHNFNPANLYRAAMEGATFTLKYGYDAFVRAGMQFDAIVLTGGGSRSPAWRQMVADVLQLPVQVPVHDQGAAFGAALQAMWTFERSDGQSLADSVLAHVALDPAQGAQPQPTRAKAYATAYKRFLKQLAAQRPATAR